MTRARSTRAPVATRAGRLRAAAHACLRAASIAVTGLAWAVVGFEVVVRCGAPPSHRLDEFSDSLRMYDHRGALLREVVGEHGMRAAWLPLDAISPLVVGATLAVEDARFYAHDGVDARAVIRATVDNLRAGEVVSGASTLSMQLARLLEPSAKTLWGKLGEMVRARRIERALAKDAILEHYLNRAPYGAGTIGVAAASARYFGKPTAHLSLAEAALLAGLPKAPTRFNPLRYPRRAKLRQRKVLARMLDTGAIDRARHDRAAAEPLVYRGERSPVAAMHFTEYVAGRVRAEDADRPGDGAVRTTLDLALQTDVEAAVVAHVQSLATAGLGDAAVLVLDNRRCAIRAMVGSADYWAPDHGAVNGVLSPRQPGSTLKPFTYALAFEGGDTPATAVADVDTRYGEVGGREFRPQNFSGKFSGPVLMGEALGRSLNVPAIRVANRVGVEALLARLRDLGFSSLDRPASHYGLGLTLGNGEVTLLELAQAYAALARGGVTCQATWRAGDGAGDPGSRVFSETVAFLITDVLSDESLRIAAFGPGNALLLEFPVAVKTGTSTNWRDSWTVGYTERFTVAVWSGNFDGSSMNHLAGATGAGPLFHTVMSTVVERAARSPEREPKPGSIAAREPPPGVVAVDVCALSGHRPGADCPHRRTLHVQAEHMPTEVCSWHRSVTIDARNDLRAGELCPAGFTAERVFEVLPAEYARWQAESGVEVAPAAYSPLCPADGPVPGSVVITRPRHGEVYVIEPGHDRDTQTLALIAETDAAPGRVTWTVDGQRVEHARWPYTSSWRLEPGIHRVAVSAPGQRGHEVTIEVR